MGMVLTKISVTILSVTKCAMNYESYIPKLVQGKGVGLVNWPEGVEFKRMSLQSAVGPMQTLLDSLKSGVTRWKVLTTAEKKKLTDQYTEMVEKGEIKVKEKAPKKTNPRRAKRARRPEPRVGAPASASSKPANQAGGRRAIHQACVEKVVM